jgi:hypothetical protein
MDIQSQKLELIKWILETNDEAVLNAIKAIFETENKDVWKDLTPEQQEEIEIGIQNENRGDIVDF